MKPVILVLMALILAAVCAAAGVYAGYYWANSSPPATKESSDADTTQPSESVSEPAPVGVVGTVSILSGRVTRTTVAYGVVVTQPGDVHVFSVPYECRVRRLPAAAGEMVDKGTPLIEVEPSPDAKLQYQQSQVALDAARKDLAQTQQRFSANLATNSDLLQAQQAMAIADLQVHNLEQRGVSDTAVAMLSADEPGIASKIDVQEGQIVPAGQPLVETVAQHQIEVRLGVEPDRISQIKEGHALRIFPVGAAESEGIAAKVRLVTQRVNPDTRLVDVFVTPAADTHLMLDGFVRAELVQTSGPGLIVPRDAVLPDDEGNILFTVKDGHAVKHTVGIAFENNDQTLITGPGLQAGDEAVVSGNYELEDGMEVAVQPAATTSASASTEPAP